MKFDVPTPSPLLQALSTKIFLRFLTLLFSKSKIIFEFLNFYFAGKVRITESNAIVRHIGRKHGLDGKTEDEKAHVDMLENLSYNMHIDFARICYGPDFVSWKTQII